MREFWLKIALRAIQMLSSRAFIDDVTAIVKSLIWQDLPGEVKGAWISEDAVSAIFYKQERKMKLLSGKKPAWLSKGIIGAVAVIIASGAYVAGYTEVKSDDISTLVTAGIAAIGGAGLMFKRFRQTLSGLDWKATALAGITAAAGVYVAFTGDQAGADSFVQNMEGVVITIGALLSAFGIDVANKKVEIGNGR